MIVKLLVLLVLILCAVEDIKEKEIYVIFPILLAGIGLLNIYLGGVKIDFSSAAKFIIPVLAVGFALKNYLGMGDTLMFTGMYPVCGLHGCIFLLSSMSMLMIMFFMFHGVKRTEEGEEETAIPLIPFMALAYVMWMVL